MGRLNLQTDLLFRLVPNLLSLWRQLADKSILVVNHDLRHNINAAKLIRATRRTLDTAPSRDGRGYLRIFAAFIAKKVVGHKQKKRLRHQFSPTMTEPPREDALQPMLQRLSETGYFI